MRPVAPSAPLGVDGVFHRETRREARGGRGPRVAWWGAGGAPPSPGDRTRWAPRPVGGVAEELVFVFPLFLVYQVGILLSGGVQNGADFVTRLLFSALSGDPSRYLMVNLAVAVAYVAVVSWLRRERRIDVRRFGRTVGESLAYAVTMGTAIALVMTRVLGLDPRLAALAQGAGGAVSVVRGPFDALVMACGAGVHEELVFRVLLLTGVAWVLEAVMGMGRAVAWLAALAVSSVLFSAAHHIGPLGDQLRLWVFVYRVLAGAVFGLLYQLRGLAVAVYTHTLYDLYVFVIA